MGALLLSESDIGELISMRDVIDIVDRTFADLGRGRTISPAKLSLNLGDSEPTFLPYRASLNAMPAYIGWLDVAGQKLVGTFGRGRREAGLPTVNALITLVHPDRGDFLCVMDGTRITSMRTGAQSAVILRYLLKDRKDITLGIYGTGVQARMHILAFTSVFRVTRLFLYGRSRTAALKLKEEVTDLVPGEIVVADKPEGAAAADVLVTVTRASEPFLKGAWIRHGTVLFAVGSYKEIDDEAILGADMLICDNAVQCLHRGNLKSLAEDGRITKDSIFCEVGELAAGLKDAGDISGKRVIVVPIGMGCLDVAVAGVVYQRALSAGHDAAFAFDD
ncbi:MAG: ornithine cyclodeaminase family protein [Lachnospiraceae bacterium]|nr:ornithine cyclodeaminase family protein [Lachnospiraceae bacterium]